MTVETKSNDICALFNGFSGKETSYMFQINEAGALYDKTNPQDPVIKGMNAVAEENGLKLRFLVPDEKQLGYYTANRINVQLEKNPGKSSKLVIGKMTVG